MLVEDVMTTTPVTTTEATSVKAALAELARYRVTSLPVLDDRGRLVGVVSEADLIRDRVPADPRAHEIPLGDPWLDRPALVGDVMSAHAVTVRPKTDLAAAIDLITTTTIKSVPVVDGHDRVVGMLSRSDVVRVLARTDIDLEREAERLLSSVGLDEWTVQVIDGVADLTGPPSSNERALARLVAGAVPGVVEVRVG